MPIDFKSCREENAGALQEFCNRWCKQEHVESNALNSWKLNILSVNEKLPVSKFRYFGKYILQLFGYCYVHVSS